eukprot:4047879-Ditylum_brightwellii.AAC.1
MTSVAAPQMKRAEHSIVCADCTVYRWMSHPKNGRKSAYDGLATTWNWLYSMYLVSSFLGHKEMRDAQ